MNYSIRHIRVPPSTIRAENRAVGLFLRAQLLALLTVRYALCGSGTRKLCPTAIDANIADWVFRGCTGMPSSITMIHTYSHRRTFSRVEEGQSVQSMKSVITHYLYIPHARFAKIPKVSGTLGRFGDNSGLLTSPTALIRAPFRINQGWGGARDSEAQAIRQDMPGFTRAASEALSGLTGKRTVARFRFAGRSYRAVATPVGSVQVQSTDLNRLIASNTPANAEGCFA